MVNLGKSCVLRQVGNRSTRRREKYPELSVAFSANEDPVDHPEDKYLPAVSCYGADQSAKDTDFRV